MATVIWQVSEGRGRWRDFPPHLSQATEDQFKEAPTGSFTYVWPDRNDTYWSYVIDLASMTQNWISMDGTQTGSTRKIRRALLDG